MQDGAAELTKLRRRLERERRSRLDAEAIAEKGLRELYDKQQQLILLEGIADAANQNASPRDALHVAIKMVCKFTGWMLGHAYQCEPFEGSNRLVSTSIWHASEPDRVWPFRNLSETSDFAAGVGLPGRVLATASAVWIVDVAHDGNFPRAHAAARVGIKSAFAFPVLVKREVAAVLEFFADQVFEPDEVLLGLMSQIGTQLGRVVERKRAEDQLLAAQANQYELDRRLLIEDSEDKLGEQNLRLEAVLNNMLHGVSMFDAEQRLVIANNRYAELYGVPPDLMKTGTPLRKLLEYRIRTSSFPDEDVDQYVVSLTSIVAAGNALSRVLDIPDGRAIVLNIVPMIDGGFVATHEDVTERKRIDAKIAHMARHDALTNLPNRVLFREQLEQALTGVDRTETLAVLYLDLDRFKRVNDALGHSIGDGLLRAVTERLQACLRATDTIARLGGDEFAIVQVGVQQPNHATVLATRLIEAISVPFDIDGHEIVIGTSVGIAVAPTDGNEPDQLLRNADMALYRAKGDGRSTYHFFQPEMDAQMQARRILELDLRKALIAGQFELYYQPLVDLKTNEIGGFEALVRWNHPERGLVSPADFIPLAEEIGLIVPLGEWVLKEACARAANWPGKLSIAVNLSPVQFGSRTLVLSVISALGASGLPASRLELEITETVLLQDSVATLQTLHQLRELGVRIAMDDFGTGYSSLSYLRTFPFDKIKIDRSFVGELGKDNDGLAIVRAIAGLGTSLGMITTAEGVETREQLEMLRTEGCSQVQGYFFSPPRPAKDIPALLQKLGPGAQAA